MNNQETLLLFSFQNQLSKALNRKRLDLEILQILDEKEFADWLRKIERKIVNLSYLKKEILALSPTNLISPCSMSGNHFLATTHRNLSCVLRKPKLRLSKAGNLKTCWLKSYSCRDSLSIVMCGPCPSSKATMYSRSRPSLLRIRLTCVSIRRSKPRPCPSSN